MLDFGEIEDTGQVKWIVHIQVDPEKRGFRHGIQLPVKTFIIFLGKFAWLFGPCRIGIVDRFGRFRLHPFFRFFYGGICIPKKDRNRQKLAKLGQDAFQPVFIKKLFAVRGNMQADLSTTNGLFSGCVQGIFRAAIAFPPNGFSTFAPAF